MCSAITGNPPLAIWVGGTEGTSCSQCWIMEAGLRRDANYNITKSQQVENWQTGGAGIFFSLSGGGSQLESRQSQRGRSQSPPPSPSPVIVSFNRFFLHLVVTRNFSHFTRASASNWTSAYWTKDEMEKISLLWALKTPPPLKSHDRKSSHSLYKYSEQREVAVKLELKLPPGWLFFPPITSRM